MKILKAQTLGFCPGVKHAVSVLDKAMVRYPRIITLGDIVHNQHVVSHFEQKGVKVKMLADIENGEIVGITAHGVSPEIYRWCADNGFAVIDMTCPIVRKAQLAAASINGEITIIYGNPVHSETRGLLGWAGRGSCVIQEARLRSYEQPIRIISQTTKTKASFDRFVDEMRSLNPDCDIRAIDTTCGAVEKLIKSAVDLARRVDVMIVIGDRKSANTGNITAECRGIVKTHQVESADEIDSLAISGTVGISAGASTPGWVIDEVEEALSRK